jgi:serine/threonine protein kinase
MWLLSHTLRKYSNVQEGAYSEADARRFTSDILEALRFLHGQNIVHR